MAGRGFLKSRSASSKAQEPEKLKAEELPRPEIQTINGNASVPQVVRGRRAMLERSSQNISSTFSKIELGNFKNINCPTIIPVIKTIEPSNLLVSPKPSKQQIVDTPELKEESPPVVCRVPRESNKDSYCMTQLASNYIRIKFEKDKGVFEYRVDFYPEVDSKSARFYLFNQHIDKIPVKTFDGTLLFLPKMLPKNVTTLVAKLRDDSEVTMTITFKHKHSLRESIHFYNIFLHSIMRNLDLVQFGRSCFDQNKKKIIPEYQLEVWPGYITNIDEFENGLYLCCEVSHRVLRTETVFRVMMDIMKDSKNNNRDVKQEIMAALCCATVITHYNRNTYRIDDIDFSMNPLSTFNQGGNEVSFVDYYKKMYGIEIKNLKQPMIITNSKNKSQKNMTQDSNICCLVPELCNLTGLSENMKKNRSLMRTLDTYTIITPEVRQHSIIELVNRINANDKTSKKCKEWGLQMSPVLTKMEGPVYKRESIIMGNNLKKPVGEKMDWSMDATQNAMFVAVNIFNWAIIYYTKDESTAKGFCKQLAVCSRKFGMEINSPKPVKIESMNPEVYVSTIYNIVKSNSELQLVVIIFPNQREDRYNAVKRICCAEIGIPSQVILSRSLSRPEKLLSITQKIALQINCKLGGACWAIDIPLKNTMIVGIDAYHESKKQSNSVIGFVASMDSTFTEWYSVAIMEKNTHQELMTNMQGAFQKVLCQYKAKNEHLPDRIIIYRDGVSDGDLKHVEEIELSGLIESFKSYPENYNPKVSLIIVQKRIHTRVFQYLNERYSNPSAGTVIDNTITRRNYFDFFLVSQHSRQGTVNPTHYIVLKNGCGFSAEIVQRLTYKLCHMYYNWCGTIKVPAPVQYAHKLAFLIGNNVKKMPKDNLSNTLFYL